MRALHNMTCPTPEYYDMPHTVSSSHPVVQRCQPYRHAPPTRTVSRPPICHYRADTPLCISSGFCPPILDTTCHRNRTLPIWAATGPRLVADPLSWCARDGKQDNRTPRRLDCYAFLRTGHPRSRIRTRSNRTCGDKTCLARDIREDGTSGAPPRHLGSCCPLDSLPPPRNSLRKTRSTL